MKLFNKQNKAKAAEFHGELSVIASVLNSTYVEALVHYLDAAGLDYCNRETIDKFLTSKGLCEDDVKLLADEYRMVLGLRAQG